MKPKVSWNARSLACQFFLAGGAVSLGAMALVGLVVTHLIEEAVIHNSGAATALYVDSVVAPLLPDMQAEAVLDEVTSRALDETLGEGALGARLLSFRLWRGDGMILYSREKHLIGKTFPVSEKLRQAFAGKLVARYGTADDPETQATAAGGRPVMEIYNPVLQPWSGKAVAVLEFYENADGLQESLSRARLTSWLAVAGVTAVFFLILSVLVLRGSRTIESQRGALKARIAELSTLLDENRSLQTRLKRASQRAAALNETYLRSIGTDLHDGPLQHIAYASMRLDSDLFRSGATPAEVLTAEIDWVRSSLAEATAEIRNLCRGLMLPEIDHASLGDIVARVVTAHREKTRSSVETHVEEDDPALDPAVRICIYRFIQEALNNAFRHAGGAAQSVRAVARDGHVRVDVSDRGQGFDPAEVRPASLGLVGLRERINSLGGEFDIHTGPGGTTVTMTFGPMEGDDRWTASE